MAISYAVLFADLGKLIKHYDLQKTDGTNLLADLDEILDVFQNEGTLPSRNLPIDGLTSDFEGWESEYAGRRGTLGGYATRRLQDRETVQVELGAVSTGIDEILTRLIDQMYLDVASVNASSVTLGSTTAVSGNVGNGTIITTKTLDGVTSPGSLSGVSFAIHRRNAGRDTELAAPTETMALECIADSFRSGASEGAETFAWSGAPAISQHGIDSEGSGDVGAIQAIHLNSLLANLDFEDFTVTDTPDSWTIDAGTVSTHIFKQTVGANTYHGIAGLKFSGDGAQASIQISQATPAGSVQSAKAYCVTARVMASAAIAAGTLTIQFEGTGYTASSTEKISVAAASLPTSWTLYSFIVAMPATMPSDMKLVIKWTGTPTAAKNLWVDDVGFGPVNYGGGIGAVAVRGSTPFVLGDKFTFTVANTEGVIQRFFRRVWGYMLKSDAAAGETILDSLAT